MKIAGAFSLVRSAWAQSYGFKSLVCPSSGKDIANGKGVVSDCESEGSRMANLWSDEQKSHQAIKNIYLVSRTGWLFFCLFLCNSSIINVAHISKVKSSLTLSLKVKELDNDLIHRNP